MLNWWCRHHSFCNPAQLNAEELIRQIFDPDQGRDMDSDLSGLSALTGNISFFFFFFVLVCYENNLQKLLKMLMFSFKYILGYS